MTTKSRRSLCDNFLYYEGIDAVVKEKIIDYFQIRKKTNHVDRISEAT